MFFPGTRMLSFGQPRLPAPVQAQATRLAAGVRICLATGRRIFVIGREVGVVAGYAG